MKTEDVIITGYSHVTKEGVVLHLNKVATLKSGVMPTKEFWISWDKIGQALFDDYCDVTDVDYRRKLRGEL
jgi:hypothetical protein